MDGYLIINKAKGWTSFDVVAKIRNKWNAKVGHTGTLDPLATGVLVLCLGKATKKAQELTGFDKEYIAEVTLGATTETDDAEGEIRPTADISEVAETDISEALKQFEGEISQVPPNFSAKHIKGKRAYKLARAGKEVKLEARLVQVYGIEILAYKWPVLELKINCGRGTYIRSIARDLGKVLEVGGYLSNLKRTKVGEYRLEDSHEVEKASEADLIPL